MPGVNTLFPGAKPGFCQRKGVNQKFRFFRPKNVPIGTAVKQTDATQKYLRCWAIFVIFQKKK